MAEEQDPKEASVFAELIGSAQELESTVSHAQRLRDAELAAKKERQQKREVSAEARREKSAGKGRNPYKGWVVRYTRFRMDNADDVKKLEDVMTRIIEEKAVLRSERYSSDDTIVTVSWVEPGAEKAHQIAMKKKRLEAQKKRHTNPETGEPFLIQPKYAPGLLPGEHPGDGIVEPPDLWFQTTEEE